MGKCEKDFDRKVFSFLYILLDALPLSLISVSNMRVPTNLEC